MVEAQVVVEDGKPSVGKGHRRHDLMAAAGGIALGVQRRIVDHDGGCPVRAVDGPCENDARITTGCQSPGGKGHVNKPQKVGRDRGISVRAKRCASGSLIERLKSRNSDRRAETRFAIRGLRDHDGVGHSRGGELTPCHIDIPVQGIHRDGTALAGRGSAVDLNRRAPGYAAVGRAREHKMGGSSVVFCGRQEIGVGKIDIAGGEGLMDRKRAAVRTGAGFVGVERTSHGTGARNVHGHGGLVEELRTVPRSDDAGVDVSDGIDVLIVVQVVVAGHEDRAEGARGG